MDYLLLIVGLALLLTGSNYLVDSSVALAQRAKISSFIIGLTVVGMGTSAPELFISVTAALSGHGDLAVGNVIGSNIANLLLILGTTAAICPFIIERQNQRRDIPFSIFASVLLVLLVYDTWAGQEKNMISRLDGFTLIVLLAGYLTLTIVMSRKNQSQEQASSEAATGSVSWLNGKSPLLSIGIAAVSLAALVGGGNLFLDAAKNLASRWGMSEAVISITIVAIGTSLPELVTSIVAAIKRNPQLALGNVLGSNVFNIFMIVGLSAIIAPIETKEIYLVDFMVMIGAAVMTFLVTYSFGKKRFDRIEGFLFLTAYACYTIYLLMR